eukprot:TRINITY_DN5591_c0_g1_i2.p1 TRINITY_DN5591_c0_g1~~TRINITY_DN5591_c0_g1_i2.p1  ORF type:complete len:272 (-),score=54.52 TRINITY_DN5591_c0_g1_i2:19-834(-)
MSFKNEFKNIILVLSGKGGVGKSTVSSQLAITLTQAGYKVGLLDIDLCGPSIPRLLGVENHSVHSASSGMVPVYPEGAGLSPTDRNLSVMSIGFLLHSRNDAVIWRGPKKSAIIKQFIDDVLWGSLDYLVVDTPPGTSDEHLSITEKLLPFNPKCIIVTTPQAVSLTDVEKEINFCRRVNLPILGLIENMSGFICPCCDEVTNIFGTGGGKALAEAENIPFLGKIPIDPTLTQNLDNSLSFIEKIRNAKSLDTLKQFVNQLGENNNTDTKQ